MYQRSELFFAGHAAAKLFLQKWSHSGKTDGTIIITHGHGEHSECYHRLISAFETEKWNFIAWDLRGHGKSDGLRGYARDFDDYVLDYHLFLEKVLQFPDVKDKPVILLAHSLGALIQTCALLEKQYAANYPNIKAQILSSPFYGIALEVPKWKDSGASILNSFLPKLTLGNELKNDQLTREPEIIREYETDAYRHTRMSSGVYLGIKREFAKVLARASEINLATLMHISDKDPVVSSEAALKIFDGFTSEIKGLKIFEGAKHELYNDIIREDVFKVVKEFVNQFKK